VRSWRSGATLPNDDDLEFILDALFSDDPLLDAAREELQKAWTAAEAARGAARPTNAAPAATPLPRFPTLPRPILGREADARLIRDALLVRSERAVLVLGPGGIGKTSLTQHVANEPDVVARFPRRAFAALETAPSGTDLAAEIATSLGVSSALPFEAVIARLAEPPTLLVLDNLETPWLADRKGTEALLARLATETGAVLLGSIRGARAPATPDWVEHHVEPLPPATATALFCRHATRVAADDPYLPRLIDALGGMPLAIWLVAQRAAGLRSLEGLWAEWERQGVALASDPDMVEGRLTDVSRSILFSLDAKPVRAAGKRLFALLGQLPAGLARKDREALLGTAGFDAAGQLLGVGLAFERDGRLDLLPPVRDMARRRCSPEGRDATGWARHFLALAGSFGNRAWTSGRAQTVARLAPERANIEAATAAAGALKLANDAAAAVVGLCHFARFVGRVDETLTSALHACRASGNRLGEATCIEGLADIALDRSDHDAARSGYAAALPLYRAIGAHLGQANCIKGLADIAGARSDHNAARAGYKAALQIHRAISDRLGEANCIKGLADIAGALSDHDAARSGYEAALPIYRAIGSRMGEANCILGLAGIACDRSDYDVARSGYEMALPIYRAIGARIGEANCIQGFASIARARCDHDGARSGYEAALTINRAIGERLGEANCVHGLAHIARERSDHDGARSGYEAALTIYREIGERIGEANCIQAIAEIARERSDHDGTRTNYEAALTIYRAIGERMGAANCGLGLARVALADGQVEAAREGITAALAEFREISTVWNEAEALQALGDVERAVGDIPAAAARYRESEDAFLRIGNAVKAAESRDRRTTLGD
jgi:tetratricopeptide (TPR) repeat protein